MPTIIDVTLTDEYGHTQHVEVTQPTGAGGGFDVLVNNYHQGQIVPTRDGWRHYIRLGVLNADDVGAIMDRVNELYPLEPTR